VAHVAPPGSLATWLAAAAHLLRPAGTLSVIYRADGRDELLGALAPAFGAATIVPGHPKPGAAAIRVLVRAIKGRAAPPNLLPGLWLNRDDGRPSAEAEAVLRQAAALPLADLPVDART